MCVDHEIQRPAGKFLDGRNQAGRDRSHAIIDEQDMLVADE
jgi:hypothetical protein